MAPQDASSQIHTYQKEAQLLQSRLASTLTASQDEMERQVHAALEMSQEQVCAYKRGRICFCVQQCSSF